MKILHTAGLVLLKDGRVLLASNRNKNAFYLPGGKLEQGETSLEALVREIEEELALRLIPERLRFLFHITALAFGASDTIMEQDCFTYESADFTFKPSAEIEKIKWFSESEYLSQPVLVPGILKLFDYLNTYTLENNVSHDVQ